jgi:osmotically inducible lipoprotein OsmB
MTKRVSIVLLALALLAGCSGMSREQQRALSGGALGAAGGAVIGAVTGSVVTGALIGAAGGAAVGALTGEKHH